MNSVIASNAQTDVQQLKTVPKDWRFALELERQFFKAYPRTTVFCRPVHLECELWQRLFEFYPIPKNPYALRQEIDDLIAGRLVMRVERLERGVRYSLVARRDAVCFQADFFTRGQSTTKINSFRTTNLLKGEKL
jgi:hypothetical protein